MPKRPSHTPPHFIVLDGIDGCGKTTQARRLVQALAGESVQAASKVPASPGSVEVDTSGGPLHLREPGSTVAGERIRDLVLDPKASLGRGSLALLFAAARRETLEQLVAPALNAGRNVVIERFHASTFAYQGGTAPDGEVDPFGDEDLLNMLRGWAGRPAPTLEIVLDLPPERAFDRATAREGGGADRFEARGLTFQQRVAEAMRAYVARTPRAVLVDATGSEDEVAARVLVEVNGPSRTPAAEGTVA